jgi:uncharacterized metal-binding protein YceD (DUF177 family)
MPPEVTRPLVLAHVPASGADWVLRTSAEERTALALRFGIEAVEGFEAWLRLAPREDGVVLASGGLRAAVVQLCVISMEPVAQEVTAPLAYRLLPPGMAAADTPADEADDIESANGLVDLGELLAEELALALDPYPRHPEARLPPEVQEEAENPFAALARLNKPQPDG